MANRKQHYLDLIDATLRHALADAANTPIDATLGLHLARPAIAVRLGLLSADAPTVRAAVERVRSADANAPVIDGLGHRRPIYRPMLERSIAAIDPAAIGDGAIGRVEAFAASNDRPTADAGGAVAAALFDANTVGSSDASLAAKAFDRVIAAQSAAGLFLSRTSADQLEPAWYHELAVLHAVTLFARSTRDAAANEAVRRSARYHAEQVQPDHASSHPFALAALLDDEAGVDLADMMLHAAGVQQPKSMDAASLILLADALDCERAERRA